MPEFTDRASAVESVKDLPEGVVHLSRNLKMDLMLSYNTKQKNLRHPICSRIS